MLLVPWKVGYLVLLRETIGYTYGSKLLRGPLRRGIVGNDVEDLCDVWVKTGTQALQGTWILVDLDARTGRIQS